MTIPAGYQLQISTWENDGDSYTTQIISGLTEEDVKFHLEIASKFKSRNGLEKGGLGNGSVSQEDIVRVVQEALEKHPNISSFVDTRWSPDEEQYVEYMEDYDSVEEFMCEHFYEVLCDDILGSPVDEYYWNEPNFCRVFEDYKVFYFEQPAVEVAEKFPA